MDNSRKSVEPNRQQKEHLREERKRVEQQVQEEHRRFRELIAERRQEANLSREQLAAIAGVSPSTIRNIERGRCKSIAQETLNRLRSVSQLRLPLSLDDNDLTLVNGYNAIWLPDYDPYFLNRQAQENLFRLESRMPYSALMYSKEGVDLFQFTVLTGSFGKFLISSQRGISQIADRLPLYLTGKKIDISFLTTGYGWGEFRLIDWILHKRADCLGRISLVSENNYLIFHGLREFERQFSEKRIAPRMIVPVLGRHASYIEALETTAHKGRQRLFCMIGTLMNLDNCIDFIHRISHKMVGGDLLLFDINIPFGPPDNRKIILDKDPRLSQRLPINYVSAVEQSLAFDLRVTDASIEAIDWLYELDDPHRVSSNSMEAYSVHMNAALHRASSPPQSVSVMRIHRHDPQALMNALASHGLAMVQEIPWEEDYGVKYPSRILLFVKK